MLTNPETSHFRKYLATLGVSIMLGSLGIGGFLLRNSSDLMVTNGKLEQLTPLARDAIEHRQTVSYTASIIAPYLVGVGALFGLTLTLFGLIGWARRQKVADRTEDLEQVRIEAEIRQLTDSERIERAQQDAVEDMLDTVPPSTSGTPGSPPDFGDPVPDGPTGPPGNPPPQGSPPGSGVDTGQPDPHTSAKDHPDYEYPHDEEESRAEKILLTEYALADKLTNGFSERHIEATTRIDVSGNQLYADGLVMPTRSQDGYVITLKVVSGDGSRRTAKTQERANELATVLESSATSGKFKPVAIIVYRDGKPLPTTARAQESVRTLTFDFDTFLHLPGTKLRELIEEP